MRPKTEHKHDLRIITDSDRYDLQRIIDAVEAISCPVCLAPKAEYCQDWGNTAVHLAREQKAIKEGTHRLYGKLQRTRKI